MKFDFEFQCSDKHRVGKRGILNSYKCPHCGGWHVGNRPLSNRR
jgi:hypothetical protein